MRSPESSRFQVIPLALAMVLMGTGVGRAQFPGRPQLRPERVEAKGTVEFVQRGVIGLTTTAGEKWRVQVAPNATVQVLGTATANVLQPRQCIAFSAQVDKKRGVIEEKVETLTIFTPTERRMLGAFPSQGALGAGGLGEGGGLAQAPFGGRPAAGADTGPPIEEFDIGAQITGVKNGKLQLVARNPYFKPTFEIELAEEPEISLELVGLNYLALAKPGDSIEAQGTQVGPNAAQVNEVVVELAEPLGTQQESPERPTRRATRSSRRARIRGEAAAEEEAEGETEPEKTDREE